MIDRDLEPLVSLMIQTIVRKLRAQQTGEPIAVAAIAIAADHQDNEEGGKEEVK